MDPINVEKPAGVHPVQAIDLDAGIDNTCVIKTGTDVANHLISLRDDFDPAMTFRNMLLASGIACFVAAMTMIYKFKPTESVISGTFLVLLSYVIGTGWASVLPRGDKFEARWMENGGQGDLPWGIRALKFINNGPWSLKEHAICQITASSAGGVADACMVFAAQILFYDLPLSATTIILSTISINLFGYGLCGLFRPISVWHPEAVYWGSLPVIKSLQGLHWQEVRNSRPLRLFWYAFAGMGAYEIFPAWVFPWLNSVSIPCLAAQKTTGNTAGVLTNVFGGSVNNEGLGLFSLTLDWQYITSSAIAYPLTLQLHTAIGTGACFIFMIGIYYGNVWSSKSLPFMSSRLLTSNGTRYPIAELFPDGVLDESILLKFGVPKLSGSFVWGVFCAFAAIGALIVHCLLFWGKDMWQTSKRAMAGKFDDRHHTHMINHYKEAPWWWYALVLLASFFLGLIVVLKEDITLKAWAYVVALIIGSTIAPFSIILYSRYGNGIATNQLSKMLAGLMIPGRPVGNMYFAAWSHNVIVGSLNLSNDLKMGEYLKIPPRVMFVTQIWGTLLGGFISYAVMISIVSKNRDLLSNGNGNASWSGVNVQSYNTTATAWALAKYFFKSGAEYSIVPYGMVIGGAIVVVHRIFCQMIPKIRKFDVRDINMPQFIQYAGWIQFQNPQTCTILTPIIVGVFAQYYLRNYRPRIFHEYLYLFTGGLDAGSFLVLFILSFAVLGAGGVSFPMPSWWGNNVDGYYDWCPSPSSVT
ncbi:OPT superfamily oligopeptide transporter [Penicillium verhagenii]|nr:OPT superfamily oligopeptide transporter [Penicillium verhagenii]